MKATRRRFLIGSATFIASASRIAHSEGRSYQRQELWFDSPAKRWMEALPVGNGRIGGMVYGDVAGEEIALTESTCWSGAPSSKNVNPSARANLSPVRELMFAGRYAEASNLCKQYLLGKGDSFGTNLSMATLKIDSVGESSREYRRSLDLEEAVAHVAYRSGDLRFHREVFCSNPANVLAIRLTCDRAKSVNTSVSFAKLSLPGEVTIIGGDTLVLRGHAYERLHSNGRQGVAFELHVRIVARGGRLALHSDNIEVHGADDVFLLVAVHTDFHGGDPSALCKETLQKAALKSYKALRAEHVADYRRLFLRTSIDLGRNAPAEANPTDRRRAAVQEGHPDPALAALFFQYGRYLTIAGSRANSPLPLALQGIWNDGLASSMGWTDDFHLDINTQQNYWLAEVGNLSECQMPVFDFVDRMRFAGRSVAEEMYGASGWVCHVVTNPWGYSAPGWGLGWGLFPTGGLWLSLQLWEHYQFTADRKFLAERVYPVFKEAAEFFLAYMVKHPKHGWLITGPAVSPENSFIASDGSHCSESMGPTCDRVLVFALLNACVEATKTLGLDPEFRARAQDALNLLPPFQIGKHGQIQEWLEDFEEANPGHRHTSHLLALYPERQISPEKTPQLAQAARITLERRISQPTWEDSEWSRANMVNFYARLFDGDSAHKHLLGLLSHATESSLLTYSRGGVAGAESNIFALDGNTAGAAGIAEMLMQSQPVEIYLLPALPSAWPSGEISGICARGAVEVGITWKDGELVSAIFFPKHSHIRRVRYGAATIELHLVGGQKTSVYRRDFRGSGPHQAWFREAKEGNA